MASSPITSWQADGGNCWKMMETVRFHFSWAPKSTWTMIATMKLKDALLLGRKAVTNLDSVLKSRDITLPTRVYIVKAMVFPVVMYGCMSWIIKAERQRIDAFELWCWRTLKSPLDFKEVRPVNSLGNQP